MFVASLARWATRLAATSALAGLLAAVPWALITFIGWPLPRHLPTDLDSLPQLLTTPVTDQMVINLLAVAAWILWAAFLISLTAEAAARVRGVHTPPLPGLQPVQVLAGWLLSGLTAGILAAGSLTPAVTSGTDLPAVTMQAPATPGTHLAQPVATGAPPAAAAVPLPAGQVSVLVAGRQHQYTVQRGDTLWDIARAWLGDPTRWPEIWQLNQHRTWPQVSGQVRFSDPDLIYPDWLLTLPDDATPPGQPTPEPEPVPVAPDLPVEHPPPPVDNTPPELDDVAPTPGRAPAPSNSPGAGTPLQPTPSSAAPLDPDSVVAPPPGATPPGTPTAEGTVPPPAHSPAAPTPHAGAGTDDHPDDDEPAGPPPAGGDQGGVRLPDGSWLTWAMAAAIASAAAMVWLQRQRRYLPRPLATTPDTGGGIQPPAAEPETIRNIRRAVHTHMDHDGQQEPDTSPAPSDQPRNPEPDRDGGHLSPAGPTPAPGQPDTPAAPGTPPLPTVGIGLVGPGAEAAARGALVAALSAGSPTDPDAHTELVIPADTLAALLGADAASIGGWPRLHVADDLDEALAHVQARLLATARLLDEYELTNLDALRAAAPGERPVPPMLLIAATPPPGIRMRTRTVLGLGHDQQISGLLLGHWGHGPTVNVEPDGTCHPADDHTHLPEGTPARMPVLATTATLTLLQTLREAHTGQPPTPPPTQPASSDTAGSNADTATAAPLDDETTPAAAPTGAEPDEPAQAGPAQTPTPPTTGRSTQAGHGATAALPKASVRVLGPPQILNADAAAKPVRGAAWELLVHLAVHRDGATPEQIEEDIWPQARKRLAAPRLHTTASNLRHALAAAAGADPTQAEHYLRKHHGRYQLGTVQVDLWQLQDALAQAEKATDAQQRLAALRRACHAYHGDLAADHDYEWITPHRHHTQQLALQAHTTLATLLAAQHPAEAARLLTQAVRVAPLAEHTYQEAMRAHHLLGDPDAIRGLLRQLARNLDQVGAEPSEQTLELANTLRRDLSRGQSSN